MPPRRKKKNGASAREDYRWALPGGDEVSALGVGYSRMQTTRAMRGAYTLRTVANERLLMSQNQWYLGDHYGILIPTSEKVITTAYLDDLQTAQTRHQDGLEKLAADIRGPKPKSRVLADGNTKGQLGRIYKHLSNRTSRAPMAAANWQDGAVTLREGPEPLLLLHKPVDGGSFFSGPRIPTPLRKLR